jgi:hypothetical protein
MALLTIYGGRSSAGRAPDCDSGCRGFNPRRPPQIKKPRICGAFFYINIGFKNNLSYFFSMSE